MSSDKSFRSDGKIRTQTVLSVNAVTTGRVASDSGPSRRHVVEHSSADGALVLDASYEGRIVAISLSAGAGLSSVTLADDFPVGASVELLIVANDSADTDFTCTVESGDLYATSISYVSGVPGSTEITSGDTVNVVAADVVPGDRVTFTRISSTVAMALAISSGAGFYFNP